MLWARAAVAVGIAGCSSLTKRVGALDYRNDARRFRLGSLDWVLLSHLT